MIIEVQSSMQTNSKQTTQQNTENKQTKNIFERSTTHAFIYHISYTQVHCSRLSHNKLNDDMANVFFFSVLVPPFIYI